MPEEPDRFRTIRIGGQLVAALWVAGVLFMGPPKSEWNGSSHGWASVGTLFKQMDGAWVAHDEARGPKRSGVRLYSRLKVLPVYPLHLSFLAPVGYKTSATFDLKGPESINPQLFTASPDPLAEVVQIKNGVLPQEYSAAVKDAYFAETDPPDRPRFVRLTEAEWLASPDNETWMWKEATRRAGLGEPQLSGAYPPGIRANRSFILRVISVIPALLILILLARAELRAWRRRKGRCPRCGYSLAGLSADICPECGEKNSVVASHG